MTIWLLSDPRLIVRLFSHALGRFVFLAAPCYRVLPSGPMQGDGSSWPFGARRGRRNDERARKYTDQR
jgi:hypothetical protein